MLTPAESARITDIVSRVAFGAGYGSLNESDAELFRRWEDEEAYFGASLPVAGAALAALPGQVVEGVAGAVASVTGDVLGSALTKLWPILLLLLGAVLLAIWTKGKLLQGVMP